MSNHRWCCCGGDIDCCEMQSCANFVTPNSITITYNGTITRHWSTGQSEIVAEYTYTIASNSAFTQRGNNCTGDAPREFGCNTALLSYDYKLHNWVPDVTSDNYLSGGLPCSGCDAVTFLCDLDIVYCKERTIRYYGTNRTVNGLHQLFASGCCQPRSGNNAVLRLSCCVSCGCARPAIMYTPSVTLWFTANDFYTLTPGCCTSDPSESGAGTWTLPAFQIHGQCGCPTGTTWSASNIVTNCAAPDVVFISDTVLPGYGSCGFMDCNGLPQGTVYSVKLPYSWTCESDSGDPLNPTINFCEVTISAYDECSQSITVTVT